LTIITALSDLYDRSEGEDRWRDLVRTALTCKAFLDPALDLLWRKLKDVRPIVNLFQIQLDEDPIVSESGCPKDTSKSESVYLQGLRTGPFDWQRIYFYTQRLRSLTVSLKPPTFDDAMSQEYSEHSWLMFPQLRDVSVAYWEHACCTSVMVVPRLRSLSIRHLDENAATTLLRTFRECTDLRRLHVGFMGHQTKETEAAIENTFNLGLGNACNLERLELERYTPQVVIDNIGMLQHLQLLRIGGPTRGPFPTPTDRSEANKVSLPSLRSIIISGSSMEKLDALTRYLVCPLEKMTLMTQNAEEKELVSWLRQLNNQHRSTLNSLHIAATLSSLLIGPDVMSSLSGFSLVDLRLEGFLYGASPNSVIALAECFPALEVLLITCVRRGVIYFMDFPTFAKLLLRCSKLKTLSLNVDFRTAERSSTGPAQRALNLKRLDVRQSQVSEVDKIVEVFRQVLPRLKKLDSIQPFGVIFGESNPWEKIREMLGVRGRGRVEPLFEYD
jgi:hypothetical protein